MTLFALSQNRQRCAMYAAGGRIMTLWFASTCGCNRCADHLALHPLSTRHPSHAVLTSSTYWPSYNFSAFMRYPHQHILTWLASLRAPVLACSTRMPLSAFTRLLYHRLCFRLPVSATRSGRLVPSPPLLRVIPPPSPAPASPYFYPPLTHHTTTSSPLPLHTWDSTYHL